MFGMTEGKFLITLSIYLLAYAIDPFIITVTFTRLLKPKCKSRLCNVLLCFGGTYILICIKQAMFLKSVSDIANIMIPIVFIYIMLIALFAFQAPVRKKIIVAISCYIITFLIDAVYSILLILMKVNYAQIITFGLKSAILSLTMRMTDLFIFLLIKSFLELLKEKGSKPYMVMVYTILVVFSGTAIIYYRGLNNTVVIMIVYCIQTMIVLLSFVYIGIILKNVINREREAVNRAELSESKAAFLDYSHDIYEEIKEIKHDTKRHYSYLMELVQKGEYESLQHYLEQLNEQIHATDELCVCDNMILQIALTNAKRRAKQEQIQFEQSITVNTFPFTESELNSVITNLLDNALEAAAKVIEGKKYVKLEIRKINAQEILIYCENTYCPDAYTEAPLLSDNHWNRGNHGYGTKIVRKLAKRYKGSVIYWKDNKKFYAKVIV